MKYDEGKPLLSLLPPYSIFQVGKVLTYGANKYYIGNEKTTENFETRYMSAALRHIFQHLDGEDFDSESGYDHLAHAITCLIFLMERANENRTSKETA